MCKFKIDGNYSAKQINYDIQDRGFFIFSYCFHIIKKLSITLPVSLWCSRCFSIVVFTEKQNDTLLFINKGKKLFDCFVGNVLNEKYSCFQNNHLFIRPWNILHRRKSLLITMSAVISTIYICGEFKTYVYS